MLDSILPDTGVMTLSSVLICTIASLLLGIVVALVSMYRTSYTKNFILTVALLPAMVQTVILLVNGNLGAGIAVMGAFGLVRFRSAPGNAREITSIFFAMAIGLATGMGYIGYAVIFTAIIAACMILYTFLRFGEGESTVKHLRVTIPEDLEYNNLFDDIFHQYTKSARLEKVRTTNLGSLFELHYTLTMRDTKDEKAMLDKIRQRNGNLNITLGRVVTASDEL